MPLGPLPEPKSYVLKGRAFLKGSILAFFLFSTLLMLNVLQTASLLIRLFSQTAFRRFNRFLANLWWGWCALCAEKIHRTRFNIKGDEIPLRENAIVILNHQEMSDITVVFSLAKMKYRIGDLKWFVKDVLKYVPGIGWGMLFLDCLFIKRDWTADRDYIQQVFKNILQFQVPIWLMTFVEGTRVRPEKLANSRKFAEERGLTPPEHVLVPRTKGFVASVQALRGHVDAVYDITIGYVDGVPSLWQWIKGYVHSVNLHIRRFPIGDMPEDEQALTAWLINCFEEKDVLLDHYYRQGVFPDEWPRT